MNVKISLIFVRTGNVRITEAASSVYARRGSPSIRTETPVLILTSAGRIQARVETEPVSTSLVGSHVGAILASNLAQGRVQT